MLFNLFGFLPEIYLLISILTLFTFGVFYEKLSLNLINNFILFGLISLLFTLNLYSVLLTDLDTSLFICQGFLELTTFSLVLKAVVVVSTFFIFLLVINKSYVSSYEIISLITLATLGLLLIISSRDLLVLYISLELYSLSIYILAGTFKNSKLSTEASLKYLLLGALSSGFYLFGSALIYTYTGDTHFSTLINYTNEIQIGAIFVLIALFFKLAVAPFHMWAPDVYEGSPTFITGYFAIVPKIIIFGILIVLLTGPFFNIFQDLNTILYIVAILSLIVGSIGGLNQTKLKRLIAYSSISHIGFILTALLPNTIFAIQSINIYLIYYIIMSINLFAIVLTLFGNNNTYITQLSGLSRKNPILAITLSLNLLSMAGIPPLAGFLSKYYVLINVIWNEYYLLAVIAVIASTISAFYYVRIIKWIYFKDTKDFIYKSLGDICSPIKINFTYSIVLGISTYLILTLLIYPNPILLITSLSLIN